jgi:hypothetical protein
MNDDGFLADDPRWRRLHDRQWICPSCDAPHQGLMDLGFDAPFHWEGSEEREPNASAATSKHFLSEDFCVIEGRDHFVRCVLDLPIIGSGGECFGYGVWSTLSPKNFALYVETFDSGEQGALGPWFGWFSNRMKGYPETLNLKVQVHPRSGRQRPLIELMDADHPLVVEQREGVTLDRLLEIHALHGHDMRMGLLD